MGDLNIDLLMARDLKTRRLNDLLKRYDLTNMIKSSTHLNLASNRSSKLDLFITNDKLMYSQDGVVPTGMSYHSIIFVARKKFKKS